MKLTRPVELRGYEGSGMGGSEEAPEEGLQGRHGGGGLSITGNRATQSRDEVASWTKMLA